MDFNSESCDVLLFELASHVALDECCLAGTSVTDQDAFECRNIAFSCHLRRFLWRKAEVIQEPNSWNRMFLKASWRHETTEFTEILEIRDHPEAADSRKSINFHKKAPRPLDTRSFAAKVTSHLNKSNFEIQKWLDCRSAKLQNAFCSFLSGLWPPHTTNSLSHAELSNLPVDSGLARIRKFRRIDRVFGDLRNSTLKRKIASVQSMGCEMTSGDNS